MSPTILAVLALAGSLAPAAKPEFQAQTDYARAMKLAQEQKKPMAVLIGKGDPFAKLMADAKLTADAKKLLAEKYVCVTVDVTTDAGKTLAGQFDLTDGLVISSAGGSHQALRQSGTVSATDLAKHTAAYATASGVPATTVTAGAPVYSYPSFSSCPGGTCPTTVYPAGGYSGGYVLPSTTIYGSSSCPNGRCPTPTYVR
jgi:hypothetical protein